MLYAQIAKLELLFYKRVCCRYDKLFYAFSLKQMYEARTASKLLDTDRLGDVVKIDGAFSFMQNVCSSPAFWEQKKRKLFAMIWQFVQVERCLRRVRALQQIRFEAEQGVPEERRVRHVRKSQSSRTIHYIIMRTKQQCNC